jgi:hypothetical protein
METAIDKRDMVGEVFREIAATFVIHFHTTSVVHGHAVRMYQLLRFNHVVCHHADHLLWPVPLQC